MYENNKNSDAAGNISNSSNVLSVSTLGLPDTESPNIPENLTATNIGQSTLYLSWEASNDNNLVDRYNIYQNGNLITSTSSQSKLIVGLNPNTTYSFYVVAEDLANNVSDHSNEIEVTTKEKTDVIYPPTGLKATNITQNSFKLNWIASKSVNGGVEYGIFVDGVFIDKTSHTNYTITGLSPSTQYKTHIIAVDSRRNISNSSKTLKVVTLDRFVLAPRDFYKVVGIKIRPKGKTGYFMGPGFASKINVEFKPTKEKKPFTHNTNLNNDNNERVVYTPEPYLKKIQDNLDGSYNLIIGNVSLKTNPDIIITVRDNTVYEGPLYKIPLWFYILIAIVLIIIIILILVKQNKTKFYKFIWTLFVILLFIWLMHYSGQLSFLFMI